MSRYTSERKDIIIQIRVSEEVKNKIDKACKAKGKTVSGYIRDLIEKDGIC